MKKLFQQKKAFLYNGTEVREGDRVYFIDPDGNRHEGVIERRRYDEKLQSAGGHLPRFQEKYEPKILKKGTLFFWNSGFLIKDYTNAEKISSNCS